MVVDTNLCQRSKLLPSERAFAYKIQLDALREIGVKNASSAIADGYGENRKTVYRYISIAKLNKDLLAAVDSGELLLNSAAIIAGFSESGQNAIRDFIKRNPKKKITESLAAKLGGADQAGTLSAGADVENALSTAAPPKNKTVSSKVVAKLRDKEIAALPNVPRERLSDFFYFALQHSELRAEYRKTLEQQENRQQYKEGLNFDEAQLIVSETNLRQRSFSDMSHSERAVCLADHYNAIKKQGLRSDLIDELINLEKADNGAENSTSANIEHKSKSRDKIAQNYSLDKMTITRYVKIASLLPSLLEHLDSGKLAFLAAYQLAFISDKEVHQRLSETIGNGVKIGIGDSKKLREYYHKNRSLTDEEIKEILAKPPKKTKPKGVQLKPALVEKFFPKGTSSNEIEDIVALALEAYLKGKNTENGGEDGQS